MRSETPGWVPILAIALGAVSGLWVLGGRSLFATWHGVPNTPLTTFLFLVAAATTRTGVVPRYRWGIVAGLAFSAVGDAFLMLPTDWFLHGLISFFIAQLCYLWAFTYDTAVMQRRLPFAIAGLLGVLLVRSLWPGVPETLRLPVAVYATVLLAMAAQATCRALWRHDPAAILAAIGAAAFVISDAALAIQRFHNPFEEGRFVILSTYFAAQGCIALSVLLHRGGVYCRF